MQIKAPTVYYDIMSYCSPRWVSPYSYDHLMADQVLQGSAQVMASPASVLYVRATITQDDGASIAPVYLLTAEPSLGAPESEYWIALQDSEGADLVRQNVLVLKAEGDDFSLNTLIARLPLPAQAPSRVVVGRSGQVLAVRELSGGDESALQSSAVGFNAGSLYWPRDGKPAAIRYSVDGGITWQALAVDVQADTLALDLNNLLSGATLEVMLADTVAPVRYTFTLPTATR